MEPCLACGGNRGYIELYDATLLKCRCCGFVTANMVVGPDTLREIYNDNYFNSGEVFDYVSTYPSRLINFRAKLKHTLTVIDPKTIRSILEVGCAYGLFAEVVRQYLPGIPYLGVDVAEEAVRVGRDQWGVNLEVMDYLEHPNLPGSHSDIFMWDVIEHLPDPGAFVSKMANELAPGGHLVIGTPDIEGWLPRLQGRKWRNIHPPTHLHYFSPRTITTFLNRHGFDVMSIAKPAVYRNLRHVLRYALFRNGEPHGVWERLYGLVPAAATIPVNTFDNMIVAARRRHP